MHYRLISGKACCLSWIGACLKFEVLRIYDVCMKNHLERRRSARNVSWPSRALVSTLIVAELPKYLTVLGSLHVYL